MEEILVVKQSPRLEGAVAVSGAKNAVLVSLASLLLVKGKSTLYNVPHSADVQNMLLLLESLGAKTTFDKEAGCVTVDATTVANHNINHTAMKKMRASTLVMGPLLARIGRLSLSYPGGCVIGKRPIDFHLKNFKKMGVIVHEEEAFVTAAVDKLLSQRLVLEYPSVGATENLLMAATLTRGTTEIINAALEPEVLDLIALLTKMGARIVVKTPATIAITGVAALQPVSYTVMPDRLEAGSLLLAGAITGGDVLVNNIIPDVLDVFLAKLAEMGHSVTACPGKEGIRVKGCKEPQAVSFKTSPYPGFPTDLQAPMMAVQCLAEGISIVDETVFENRLVHAFELQKMGAQISATATRATITGVDDLYGAEVIASDIRAACALVVAGLAAHGVTYVSGVHHFRRGYDRLEDKLQRLGAHITVVNETVVVAEKERRIEF